MHALHESFVDGLLVDELLVRHFDGFAFLCGGEVADLDDPPMSVRDAVFRNIWDTKPEIGERIYRPEDTIDWFSAKGYPDLITFERDVAHLADSIIVIVEGAGSIAELGAFCQIEEFLPKLQVFLSRHHYLQRSFIRLGPIEFIEQKHKDNVYSYHWNNTVAGEVDPNFSLTAVTPYVQTMTEDIARHLKSGNHSKPFDPTNVRHIMLLMAGLINELIALQLRELLAILRVFVPSIEEKTVKRYLFILERLGFLHEEPGGNRRFFVSDKQGPFISFRFDPAKGVEKDPIRRQMSVIQGYKNDEDSRRTHAIESARAK